jgi:uncharacterized protein YjbI with pentapeptide repeats
MKASTRSRLAALAVLATTTAGQALLAPAAEARLWLDNGASLNGANLNGASLNGTNLNGVSPNGMSFNGTSFNGASFNGASERAVDAAPAADVGALRLRAVRLAGER